MLSQLLEKSVVEAPIFEGSLVHWVCDLCYPEDYDGPSVFSFCGIDVTSEEDILEDCEVDCIVCHELHTCPRCGAWRVEDY